MSISDQASAKELDELISSNRFSRIPVWHGSIDTIIGMIHEKDFHEAELGDNDSWKHLISPVIYVTTTSPVADLLYEMQRRKMHMSVVVDEYGGTEGLVTLEDILEELVGGDLGTAPMKWWNASGNRRTVLTSSPAPPASTMCSSCSTCGWTTI